MKLKLMIVAIVSLIASGCVQTVEDDYRDNGSIWDEINDRAAGGGE